MLKKILSGMAFATLTYFTPATAQQTADTPPLPASAPHESPSGSEVTEVEVMLKGYVFGIRLATVKFKSGFTDDEYYALASMKTSGLGAFFKKWAIWAVSTGSFDGSDVKPASHLQQNMDKKHRRVEMSYGADKVDVSIVPPLGTQGTPPASPKQRFESDDTLSVLLTMTMGGFKTMDEPCVGTVPVFDSKQHYNLRMERDGEKHIKQRGFKGETIRCKVYYEAVSGYDEEDLPSEEEAAMPVTVYLAKNEDAGVYVPIKMVYKISGFSLVIKTRDIKITKRKVSNIDFKGLDFSAQEQQLKAIEFIKDK
jgi:hypothetical protein